MNFDAEARALLPELIAIRRDLHAHPEIGLDLPRTQSVVRRALAPLDVELHLGSGSTSVTAVLRGGKPGPTVLLRADMDALPIEEETGLAFASTNGAMHACGHDLHVAGLLGAARLLAAHRDELAGTVLFMFQPGEESGGGAQLMIDEGLLETTGERPIAGYAIHVVPGEPGVFRTRAGAIMAGANGLRVVVRGQGGHGSAPHLAVDPVPVLAEIILALQSFVTRRFDVFDPVVISVTKLSAGDVLNVIPEQATLAGTVRTLSAASVVTLQEELPSLVGGIAAAHGCTAEVLFEVVYPVTLNDEATATNALATLRAEFGAARVQAIAAPMMASEDFSFVAHQVPSTFVLLGATPAEALSDTVEMNHSPRALFDDGVLGSQAAALAALAWSHLGAAGPDGNAD
ncbi:M20 family metallopeptidase [Leifsonia kafniensis]|uniref:M20 family metallopeptidase n=1 Tax=Leifsonia kafniensis TaxID=475957 RepID=A0ABP7KFB2_9MICO